ncbi:MAG: PDZ domain-containing protein [Gemmataceae bacterium]|nr:PDZ domain-containing protein [Gemmataceae bacterium]
MRRLGLLILWGLGLPLGLFAEPNPNDTRLLTQPAVSKDKIAFVYAEDLWVADLDGKNPRRLTSDLGAEGYPAFSPDGQWIAFTGTYEGNTDVYIVPVTGGVPRRLTYHPGPDIVRGFSPDGKVLFNSDRNVYTRRHMQLFLVDITGGMPEQLPIPHGFEASFSPDGTRIAYCPQRDATPQWKNYRGGTHSRIWIYHRRNHEVEQIPQPEGRCNDLDPNWLGDQIIFRSDRNGEYNVFTYDPQSKELKQRTYHEDFPVLDIAVGSGNVVYEQAGYLHRLDVKEGKSERLKIGVTTDLTEIRPRFAKGSKYIRGSAISPSGARAVFEFRGEIVTVPAEKGDPRNLTNTPGACERDPAWSPDGKKVAYFGDASGEYELYVVPQDGKGEVKKYKLEGSGFYQNLVFSRDSKKVAFVDNSQSLYVLDLESGKQTKVVEPKYDLAAGLKTSSWSHDSQWLAYAMENAAQISQVFVYSLEQNKSFPITDGLSEAREPVFDLNGKYLYFLASTESGMSKHTFMQSWADTRPPRFTLNVVVLRKDLPNPFQRESDEEKGESRPEGGRPEGNRPAGNGNANAGGEQPEEGRERPRPPMGVAGRATGPLKIDLEGIEQRILSIPVGSGNFSSLQAGPPNQLFYLSRGEVRMDEGGPRGGAMPGATLNRYDMERRRNETVQASVMSYDLTPDGRRMLYRSGPSTWIIAPTTGGGAGAAAAAAAAMTAGRRGPGGPGGDTPPAPSGDAGPKTLNVEAIEVRVDPKAEWRQIFTEAWRINRDYFYDPNMHGADWPAMKAKYQPFLEDCTTTSDLYRVIRWMLSELAVGHSYQTVGERPFEKKTVPGGLLGADYEVANGRYRFKKIYGGVNWDPRLRSPLTAPGVNVKEGEYLLAVRGVDLKPPTEIFSLFENTAGKSIEITVGPNPDGKDSRTVTVEPLESETSIRNLDWVQGNIKKVHEATNGRVAYVYVPDTAMGGLTSFKRYFFPQIDKEAVIIDERFNGGGWIADYYIDILRKPFMSYFAPRYGADWRIPSAAIHGPKVMIIDEGAGSGGDMLPWMFRKNNLGKLVGKRTWGGLVGIGGYPTLMDGGSVTAPRFAFWAPESPWGIENEGVAPDIEVEQWPKDVIAGRDPQLEKAIEVVMEELAKNPPPKHERPPYPVRVRKPAAGAQGAGGSGK